MSVTASKPFSDTRTADTPSEKLQAAYAPTPCREFLRNKRGVERSIDVAPTTFVDRLRSLFGIKGEGNELIHNEDKVRNAGLLFMMGGAVMGVISASTVLLPGLLDNVAFAAFVAMLIIGSVMIIAAGTQGIPTDEPINAEVKKEGLF